MVSGNRIVSDFRDFLKLEAAIDFHRYFSHSTLKILPCKRISYSFLIQFSPSSSQFPELLFQLSALLFIEFENFIGDVIKISEFIGKILYQN